MSGITRDEWLSALDDLHRQPPAPNDPEAVTVAEYAQMRKRSISHASHELRRLLEAGKVERTKKFVPRTGGGWYPAPAYRLIPPKEQTHHDRGAHARRHSRRGSERARGPR